MDEGEKDLEEGEDDMRMCLRPCRRHHRNLRVRPKGKDRVSGPCCDSVDRRWIVRLCMSQGQALGLRRLDKAINTTVD